MNTRKTRGKRIKYDEISNVSSSNFNEPDLEDQEELRKSRIRDSNKEYAKRMTILQTWSNLWEDYTTREGDAYPPSTAKEIIKKTKKITCPIESCGKAFTSYGGLKYHYARCLIERCYKCKACDPHFELNTKGELLKHMILKHYNEGTLPALDEEQKEIANSFLLGETKSERFKTKTTSDTEPASNPSRLVSAFFDLQNRVFESKDFSERPFKDWKSDKSEWECIHHEYDRSKFYPPELDSVRFRSNHNNQNWTTIKPGESTILKATSDGEPTSIVFFTGGVNTATAWLPKPPHNESKEEIIAIATDCGPMDLNKNYKQCRRGEACIQFWTMELDKDNTDPRLSLAYIVGHHHGTVFEMIWCPLGTSRVERVVSGSSVSGRVGLLALACGDGQIRILSVPHTNDLNERTSTRISKSYVESCPLYRARPIATLVHPGVGNSTDNEPSSCTTLAWSLEANQRYIAGGYTNGSIALFDLKNLSVIIYSNIGGCHIYHPLKSYIAHGEPVKGIAISTCNKTDEATHDRVLIASGSSDKLLRIWNVVNDFCVTSERAPITKILWDYRLRGVITATDAAFTSYNNRVSYRYPVVEGHHNVTLSTHRSIVWGLANSLITNAIATSDGAGEVFVMPRTFNRSSHKRDRSLLSIYSLYTLLPQALELSSEVERSTVLRFASLTDPEDLINEEEDNTNNINENGEQEENDIEADADFSAIERPVANKPEKFLLPLEHRPMDLYSRFKFKFGLEYVDYNQTTPKKSNSKVPESCARAGNLKNIYCDRNCDYPFSSINHVAWSPNVNTYSHLLSAAHVGLCRLDKIQAVELIFKHLIDNMLNNKTASSATTATTTTTIDTANQSNEQ